MNQIKLLHAHTEQDFMEQSPEITAEIIRHMDERGFHHPARRLTFLSSRMALIQLQNDQEKPSYDIDDFHCLSSRNNQLVSLSHTYLKDDGIALAIAMLAQEHALSIGIDFEIADRPIKAGIEKFFLHPQDDEKKSHLELWVIKEACFKAISSFIKFHDAQESEKWRLTLTKIKIDDDNFNFINDEGEEFSGYFSTEISTYENYNLLIAKAYLKEFKG